MHTAKKTPVAAVVLVLLGLCPTACGSNAQQPSSISGTPASEPSPTLGSTSVRRPSTKQVAMPFNDLYSATGVAVDTVGNVFVTDYDNGEVLKLPAGFSISVSLPF